MAKRYLHSYMQLMQTSEDITSLNFSEEVLTVFLSSSFVILQVVEYTGKRDLETMSKFLDDGGVLPEEPAEEHEESDEDIDEEDGEEGENIDDAGDDDKVCTFTPTLFIFLTKKQI